MAFVCLWLFISLFDSSLSSSENLKTKNVQFLNEMGYLSSTSNKEIGSFTSVEKVYSAILKFQKLNNLPETGKFDVQTTNKLQQARCGVKDVVPKTRQKRFVLQGSRWYKKVLTYHIENYSTDMSRAQIHKTIRLALSKWEAVSLMRFVEVDHSEANIKIRFARKDHGDPHPFDGPGNTLAHAFYPGHHELAGDTHFDDDELFTVNSNTGKNFAWVALHEFGHSLGLDHNMLDPNSIMYPWYETSNTRPLALSRDDIAGIQHLYGHHDGFNLPNEVAPFGKDQNLCIQDIKTIVLDRSGATYVFSRGHVFTFDKQMYLEHPPVPIHQKFKDVDQVDVAFTKKNGRTVFIHRQIFWEFMGTKLVKGPSNFRRIGFTSEMEGLDAAVRWHANGKVYLFKGEQYWRYDERRYRLDPGYPKLIRDAWLGVPNNLNAVFEWHNKNVYFFKGLNYYRFDNQRFQIADGYPLPSQFNFFRCGEFMADSVYLASNAKSKDLNTYLVLFLSLLSIVLKLN